MPYVSGIRECFSLGVPGLFQQAAVLTFEVAVTTAEGKHLSPHKEGGCVSCSIGNACVCSMLPAEMTCQSSLERCSNNQLEFIVKKDRPSEKPMGCMVLG